MRSSTSSKAAKEAETQTAVQKVEDLLPWTLRNYW
jgi:hypothetical protein